MYRSRPVAHETQPPRYDTRTTEHLRAPFTRRESAPRVTISSPPRASQAPGPSTHQERQLRIPTEDQHKLQTLIAAAIEMWLLVAAATGLGQMPSNPIMPKIRSFRREVPRPLWQTLNKPSSDEKRSNASDDGSKASFDNHNEIVAVPNRKDSIRMLDHPMTFTADKDSSLYASSQQQRRSGLRQSRFRPLGM